MVLFLLLLLLVFLMLVRNAGVGFIMVAFVWLLAMIFNPHLDSGTIWLIGFALGYLMDNDE